MLPKSVFEQITRAAGLRGDKKPTERRKAQRIPVRLAGSAHRIELGKVGQALSIRIRDLSMTGGSMLTTGPCKLGLEFLLQLQVPAAFGTPTFSVWLWCTTRRQSEYDRTCTVTSVTFKKMLAPDYAMKVGSRLDLVEWLNTEDIPLNRAA